MNSTQGTVGNSFRLGFRFQRYWDTSMALAFFFAETGAGLFAVSCFAGSRLGMWVGLALVATLKPYFHLAHMGVPGKSWRAIVRPDRSWVSRGLLGLVLLIGAGLGYLLAPYLGLPEGLIAVLRILALLGALVVLCYQGFAMADAVSFALWANPLVPVLGLALGLTAGALCCAALGASSLPPQVLARLLAFARMMLVFDAVAILAWLVLVQRKSAGGAFSVGLLLRGEYAASFIGWVVLAGFLLPLGLLLSGGAIAVPVAALLFLAGFLALRLLIFKAAVYEPIMKDVLGLGLAGAAQRG